MKYSNLILIVVIFLFASCKKNVDSTLEYGYEYFGLEKGNFVEYKVSYMEHDSLLQKHDTTHFYYKTVIGDEYIDNEGRKGYEYLRYRKDSLQQEYTFLSKWSTFIADFRAELVEENQKKIKLIFPLKKNETWNVNSFNMNGERLAFFEEVHKSKNIGNHPFDSTATIEIYRYKTLIDDRLDQEVYAKNIGMIYKVSKDLYFQFGWTLPYRGTEIYYEYLNSGKE